MTETLTPAGIHPPFAPYSHGVLVPPGQRLVFVSGQLGVRLDGTAPDDCAGQAEVAFANIAATLAEAGMDLSHVIKLNAFVTGREHLRPYMDVRNRLFSAPYPASTLMVVSGFARPEFVIEIEAIAAGPA